MGGPRHYTALVLAGSRRGATDPVAKSAGVAHKSLVPVGGRAMLLRVLDTLRAAPSVGPLAIAVESRTVVDALPELAASVASKDVAVLPTAGSPAGTMAKLLASGALSLPLLVTTSDHALLDVAMVETFCTGVPDGVDVAAALCTRSTIERAYPASRRSYIRLGREAYSGCNLFAFLTPDAVKAAHFWTRMERHRKTPWRYAAEVGIGPLLDYVTGRLTLERMSSRLSRMMGVRAAPVLMPMAEAAIDVDTPGDLRQVEAIVSRRS
jgi:GTP:adenosylcobinamide-phosphate guanylyltransferase